MDHTADVQLHSWGSTLNEAIEQIINSMYAYMTTDISLISSAYSMDFSASGSDLCVLLYNLMDSCLYNFSTEPFFIGCYCRVLNLKENKGEWLIELRAWGESFDLDKHPPGTEIKAITYSNMQIIEPGKAKDKFNVSKIIKENNFNIFVIVDI